MAQVAEQRYRDVRRVYEHARDRGAPLPEVDPTADDYLEQLFAWGDAFREYYGVSPEDVDRAIKRVEARTRSNEGRP